jgi:hypothetical protein
MPQIEEAIPAGLAAEAPFAGPPLILRELIEEETP